MSRAVILTSLTIAQDHTLVLYRHGPLYHVGRLSSHRKPFPFESGTYTTYAAAQERLMAEARGRRPPSSSV
jgi:hypothetical protein